MDWRYRAIIRIMLTVARWLERDEDRRGEIKAIDNMIHVDSTHEEIQRKDHQ